MKDGVGQRRRKPALRGNFDTIESGGEGGPSGF